MSEYQYYDFRSVDKALTKQQQESVSSLSSRANISPYKASFTYHYGDFRGNTEQLMSETFDIMLYVSNWGTQRLMFRFSQALLDVGTG